MVRRFDQQAAGAVAEPPVPALGVEECQPGGPGQTGHPSARETHQGETAQQSRQPAQKVDGVAVRRQLGAQPSQLVEG
jgi:hypothetical protein